MSDQKTCSKCGQTKPLGEFYKAAGCKDGHRGECRSCSYAAQQIRMQDPYRRTKAREYLRAYMADPVNKDRSRARQRERYATNDRGFRDAVEARRRSPESQSRQRQYQKKRQSDPVQIARQKARKSSPSYKEWRRRWYLWRRSSDEDFRVSGALRSLLKVVLRITGKKKSTDTEDALGYSAHQLRERIAFQFKPGMSWANHGEWHIDHKKPVSAFLRQGITDPKVINMLCNLQPLWAADNIIKNDKWPTAANDNGEVREVA